MNELTWTYKRETTEIWRQNFQRETITEQRFGAFIAKIAIQASLQRLKKVYHQQEHCQGSWLGTYLAAKPPPKSFRNTSPTKNLDWTYLCISIMEMDVGPEKGWGFGNNL